MDDERKAQKAGRRHEVRDAAGDKIPGLWCYISKHREHEGKKDKCFYIRYKLGKTYHEECVGWASQGCSPEAAQYALDQVRKSIKYGEDVVGPKEKRRRLKEKLEAKEAEEKRLKREALTFGEFFRDTYLPDARLKKAAGSVEREEGLFQRWIAPVIGKTPLQKISVVGIERIRRNMITAGAADRSVEYCFAVCRQVLNSARDRRLIDEVPVVFSKRAGSAAPGASRVTMPKIDNASRRYLTPEEAARLLEALREKSEDVYGMTLLGLRCGCRFGELASLKWQDIDLEEGRLVVRTGKTASSAREVYFGKEVQEMLESRPRGKPSEYIFATASGKKLEKVSNTFPRVIKALGFNDGVEDRKDRVVFHTTRHSYGTFAYGAVRDIYAVSKSMGHSTIQMTTRYAKMQSGPLRDVSKAVDRAYEVKPKGGQVVNLNEKK
ncbi:MAG TPA: site-specific integrase [Syntrophales bacterium]|nr:site-specific integrase [Syntrophales bacterium]HPN24871.1 site-specific integrase [Syntrophales bacterium]